VEHPKARVCLGAKHNLELATNSFSAQAVRTTGNPFTRSWRDSPPVRSFAGLYL
jgi:hypothetical protein